MRLFSATNNETHKNSFAKTTYQAARPLTKTATPTKIYSTKTKQPSEGKHHKPKPSMLTKTP
jgi:hypothetical protein